MANHLGQMCHIPSRNLHRFLLDLLRDTILTAVFIMGKGFTTFLIFLKAVSTSLTESTLKNVPQVVNVRELKTGALTPAVSTVIG